MQVAQEVWRNACNDRVGWIEMESARREEMEMFKYSPRRLQQPQQQQQQQQQHKVNICIAI